MQIIAEELSVDQNPQFQKNLDEILVSMQNVLKKIENAYASASDPNAKVLLAGIHSDAFNMAATSRDFIRKMKKA